jgi:hypothetical protein
MKVLECSLCGQVVQADSEEELVGVVSAHAAEQHPDADLDEGAVRDMGRQNAYDATDA